ncbi:mechanosensitive ion channel family protein [Salinibacillus xinjiangensis]|uniref:Mechanosensitive ion channel n=1 Tax=Salinibacillus xinjiangensis TaxID=1229268 RepID=A0A6G1X977_9BACI|nr:mechanosensitive ion channel [Salinibacillus xinjiangensis]
MQEYWNSFADLKITKLIIGAIVTIIIVKFIRRVVNTFFKRTNFIEEREEKTLEAMIKSIVRYTATFGYIIFALTVFDVPVTNLLAGAGVAGIVIGLGAQSVISDFLSGVFLLYEKQLHKGDFITVNNTFTGTVEDIGLRFLKIREWSGKLITISNGRVNSIENYNIDQMRIIEDITTSYHEDPTRVYQVLVDVCVRLNEELDHYLKKDVNGEPFEQFQVYGMSSLNDGFRGYKFTIIGLTNDEVFFSAAKEARMIIAEALYQNNIQMAMQHVDIKSAPSE